MGDSRRAARDTILRRRALLLASTLGGFGVASSATADEPSPTAPPAADAATEGASAAFDSLPYRAGQFTAQQEQLALWPCEASDEALAPADAQALLAPPPDDSDDTTAEAANPDEAILNPDEPILGETTVPGDSDEVTKLLALLLEARQGEAGSALRVRIGDAALRAGYRALGYLAYEAALRCGHRPEGPLRDATSWLSAHIATASIRSYRNGGTIVPDRVKDRRKVFLLPPKGGVVLVDSGISNVVTDEGLGDIVVEPGGQAHVGYLGEPRVCLSPPYDPPPPSHVRFGLAAGLTSYISVTSAPLAHVHLPLSAMLDVALSDEASLRPFVVVAPGLNNFGFGLFAGGGLQIVGKLDRSLALGAAVSGGYRYLDAGFANEPGDYVARSSWYLQPELQLLVRADTFELGAHVGAFLTPEDLADETRIGGGPSLGLWISYLFGSNDYDYY